MNEANTKKTKKRKKWPIAVGIVAAVIVVGLIAASALRPSVDAVGSAYQQATAQKGSIVNTVVGSGSLAYGDSVDIKIPTGIKIDEVLVEEGDHVESGQALATVDIDSIKIRLAELQEQLNDLDEEINSTKGDTEADVIKSHVAGRVKIIDAAEGSEASDIMVQSGSLMTISIDGKMAVEFESTVPLSTGDDVDVTLSDGTVKEGTVAGRTNGKCIVTLTDNGPEAGEAVTVQDEDGNTIGQGTLAINNPITIAGTGGTIDTIHVEENDTVNNGTKLMTLDGASASAEHIELQSERSELMETYNTLVSISQTGTITSGSGGTVGTVNVTEDTAVTASAATSSDTSQTSSDSSQTDQSQMSGMFASNTGSGDLSIQLLSVGAEAGTGLYAVPLAAGTTEISDLTGLALAAPVTGAAPQAAIDGSPAYTGTVQWLPADATFAGDTAYTAVVSLTANTGYQFSSGIVPAVDGAQVTNIALNGDAEGNTLTFNATFGKTASSDAVQQPNTGGMAGDYGSALQDSGSAYSAGSLGSLGSSGASTYSGATSTDTSSAASTDSSANETVAFTISTDDEMTLAINIDELDILSISEGMEASIVFDAMESETYEGTIKSVADAAQSSSGVAKYTAEITMPKDDSMRAGMNATATIVIEQTDDVLTLPVDALQERGSSVFVYTQLDPETNLPRGEVEVTTGLSDGESVEITGGLSDGDTVYYMINTSDSSDMMAMFGGGMGGGQMPGGEMPGGGNMQFGG